MLRTLRQAVVTLLVAGAISIPGFLLGSTVGPLTTFVTGTVASADQMNANFAAVKDAVDDNASDIAALSQTIRQCRRVTGSTRTGASTGGYFANCNAGEIAVSGGPVGTTGGVVMIESYPSTGLTGWTCYSTVPAGASSTCLAVCCTVSP